MEALVWETAEELDKKVAEHFAKYPQTTSDISTEFSRSQRC